MLGHQVRIALTYNGPLAYLFIRPRKVLKLTAEYVHLREEKGTHLWPS